MNRSTSTSLAAAALAAALGGCTMSGGGMSGGAMSGGESGWRTLVDGTRGLDNFERVGEANWTASDGAIQLWDSADGQLRHELTRHRGSVWPVVWRPDQAYNVWHDRAVFHFLTEPELRAAYRSTLEAGTVPGALMIVATFAPDGPERCSGLPVRRYDAAALAGELGPSFSLRKDWREEHTTPGGGRQAFQWCVFERGGHRP